MAPSFDIHSKDAQAMPVEPVEPRAFDYAAFADHEAAAEARYAAFLEQREGVAVWQRVRVADVFRDGCRDMGASLRWQLGGLTKSLNYATDAATYLEPWYGIGVTAGAFGGEYNWPRGRRRWYARCTGASRKCPRRSKRGRRTSRRSCGTSST
jgi:hypothetical protein